MKQQLLVCQICLWLMITVCNNTELQLPSRLIFSDYLQKDSDDSLCLQKKIILPVNATKRYTDFTLVAEISNSNQKAMQHIQNCENFMEADSNSSSDRDSSNKNANRDMAQQSTQDSYSINKDDEFAEIDKINNLRYFCNFCCLPTSDQKELLSSKKQSNANINVVSVHEATKQKRA